MRHNGCCSSSNIPNMHVDNSCCNAPINNSCCNAPINNSSCNAPVKRYLEPVLVAQIYNQPIIEEYANYSTSMDFDYTTTLSNFGYNSLPIHFDP